MTERFSDWWQYPEIEDGKPNKYNWVVQNVDNFDLGYKTDIGAFTYINAKHGVLIEDFVQIGSHCSIYSVSTIDNRDQRTEEQRPLVLASTLTFIGSVSPATFEGCDITFIDCDRKSWNMDPELLEEELERCGRAGRLPVAVIPTDLYGQSCDLARIVAICDRSGVPVICDSAEALGARYCKKSEVSSQRSEKSGQIQNEKFNNWKSDLRSPISDLRSLASDLRSPTSGCWRHAGAGAKAAIFSFNGNKIITTSGGGMLASDDEQFVARARFLSQQARDPFPHYEHTQIGYNYRMSNILAAIGRGQLRVIEDRVERKREIFDYYREKLGDLSGIEFMPEADYGQCTRWLTVITVDPELFGADRETIRLALEAENIESRPVWKPMHLQPVFQRSHYPSRVVGGQVSEQLFEMGLCLPSGTAMTEGDLSRVVDAIKMVRINLSQSSRRTQKKANFLKKPL